MIVTNLQELKKPCEPCSSVEEGEEIGAKLLKELGDKGVGLAANQIGINKRVCVINVKEPIVLINPTIVEKSKDKFAFVEGCLSFPFLFLMINRPKWVNVQYTDENGETVEEYLHGMSARIFQHENEHMNGYIFTDLVSKMKLDRAKKAQAKLIKQTIRAQQQRLLKP